LERSQQQYYRNNRERIPAKHYNNNWRRQVINDSLKYVKKEQENKQKQYIQEEHKEEQHFQNRIKRNMKPKMTLERIPINDLEHYSNSKLFKLLIKTNPEKTKNLQVLIDTGATFTCINQSVLNEINQYNEFIVLHEKPFNVSTGNGNIIYSGKYINMNIQRMDKPTRYVTIKAYITPKELPHKCILGSSDQRKLGYVIAIKSGNKIYFQNEGKIQVFQ
jgi:predicted aspartyl protease